MIDWQLALKILDTVPNALINAHEGVNKVVSREIQFPNIKIKVLDKGICWMDLAEFNGWKIQQNTITKHARILDSEGYRIACGTINGMEKVLGRIIEFQGRYKDKI